MNICILCKSSRKDDIQYGEFLRNKYVGVHMFCLYLSSNLLQNGNDDEGFLGFLQADIEKEVSRISLLKCCYCLKKYANIGCCEKKCRRSFHLVCGLDHNSQHQFSHDFRSYCSKHSKKVSEKPSNDETCLICYELLCAGGKKLNSGNAILTPCCRNGWFHKICLQKFAKTAGYFFKCPLCNDAETFREELPAQGIFIPNQDAAWELEPNAFAELLERPNECCALLCKNKRGRKTSSENNPFLTCITCGSKAIHTECLNNDINKFYCSDCSVTFEEGDSGRESLNSHANGGNNEDEYIDVCNVSDEEDVRLIANLIQTNNKKLGKKRDPGSQTDTSGEEMAHTTKDFKKPTIISKINDENVLNTFANIEDISEQQSGVASDSRVSDAIKPVAPKQKRRIGGDASTYDLETDSSGSNVKKSVDFGQSRRISIDTCEADAMKPVSLKHKRRIGKDSSTSYNSETDSSDSNVIKPAGLVQKRCISSGSSATDDTKSVALRQKRNSGSDSSSSYASEADSSGSNVIKPGGLAQNRRISSGSSSTDDTKSVALRQKRNSGSNSSSSYASEADSSGLNAIKPVGLGQNRRISSGSSGSDAMKSVNLRQKRNSGSDSSSSYASAADSSRSNAIKPVGLGQNRRISSGSSGSDAMKSLTLRQKRNSGSDSSSSYTSAADSSGSNAIKPVGLAQNRRISNGSSGSDAMKSVISKQERRISSDYSISDAKENTSSTPNKSVCSDSTVCDAIRLLSSKQEGSIGSDSSGSYVDLAQRRRISSDSCGSDGIKPATLKHKSRIGSDSSTSYTSEADSSASNVIKPVSLAKNRRLSSGSSGSDAMKSVALRQERTIGSDSSASEAESSGSNVIARNRSISIDSTVSDTMKSVTLRQKRRISSDYSSSDANESVASTLNKLISSVCSVSDTIKPVALRQKRRISSDLSAFDIMKPVVLKQKRRISSDSSSSESALASQDRRRKTKRCDTKSSVDVNSTDSGNGEINERDSAKRFSTDSLNIKYNICIKFRDGNAKSPDIFKDSDSDYERMSDLEGFPIAEKDLHCTTSNKRSEANGSESDDPLEIFSPIIEKKNNKRRSNPLSKPQNVTRKEDEKNYVNLSNNEVHQTEKDSQEKQNTRRKFVNIKSLQNATDNATRLDISCIAKRTRRKTIHNSSSQIKKEQKEHVNPLNISCIALRTRRKTICSRTEYSKKLLDEMPHTFENHPESKQIIEIITDDDDDEQDADTEMKSSDISCIAKRTRKRLRTTCKPLPKIDEVLESEFSGTNSSHMVNKNRNTRDSPMCSYYHKELGAASSLQRNSAAVFSNMKNKSIRSPLLLDKFPQRNFNVFRRSNRNS